MATEVSYQDVIRSAYADEVLVKCKSLMPDPRDSFASSIKVSPHLHKSCQFRVKSLIATGWLGDLAKFGPGKLAGVSIGEAVGYPNGRGYGEQPESLVEAVPKDFGLLDAALLLAATGTVDLKIPLELAILLDERTASLSVEDQFQLASLPRSNSVKDLRVVATSDLLCLHVLEDNNLYRLWMKVGDHRESGAILDFLYRAKAPAERKRFNGQPFLHQDTIYHTGWANSVIEKVAAYGFKVQDVADLVGKVGTLLQETRANPSAVSGDDVVSWLVRGIRARYEPLTGNCPTLTPECRELQLSPADCFDEAQREFAEIGSCPVRGEVYGAVAKFITIMSEMKRGRRPQCNVRPADVRHAWHFKIRTHDHTWIAGTIYRTDLPEKKSVPEPIKLPSFDKSGCMTKYAEGSPWSDWFGTSRIQCRVRETRD